MTQEERSRLERHMRIAYTMLWITRALMYGAPLLLASALIFIALVK